MATERKQETPREDEPPRLGKPESEKRPASPDEAARDGMPGYGQPDEEVRDKHLPDQEW